MANSPQETTDDAHPHTSAPAKHVAPARPGAGLTCSTVAARRPHTWRGWTVGGLSVLLVLRRRCESNVECSGCCTRRCWL
jgi:hypothetical protein